ncbi:hypothetical protein FOVSG1_002215 [Fusarium oxysporum f. sp. vasinfectum]
MDCVIGHIDLSWNLVSTPAQAPLIGGNYTTTLDEVSCSEARNTTAPKAFPDSIGQSPKASLSTIGVAICPSSQIQGSLTALAGGAHVRRYEVRKASYAKKVTAMQPAAQVDSMIRSPEFPIRKAFHCLPRTSITADACHGARKDPGPVCETNEEAENNVCTAMLESCLAPRPVDERRVLIDNVSRWADWRTCPPKELPDSPEHSSSDGETRGEEETDTMELANGEVPSEAGLPAPLSSAPQSSLDTQTNERLSGSTKHQHETTAGLESKMDALWSMVDSLGVQLVEKQRQIVAHWQRDWRDFGPSCQSRCQCRQYKVYGTRDQRVELGGKRRDFVSPCPCFYA